MIDKILVFGLLLACFCLWLQNFALTRIIRRVDRQNQELRKRLITVEDYLFGIHTEDKEFWEAINYGK